MSLVCKIAFNVQTHHTAINVAAMTRFLLTVNVLTRVYVFKMTQTFLTIASAFPVNQDASDVDQTEVVRNVLKTNSYSMEIVR